MYVFNNAGNDILYTASADWMTGNLSRRIEVAFPVYDKKIKSQLLKKIAIQWNVNSKVCESDALLSNNYRSLARRKRFAASMRYMIL